MNKVYTLRVYDVNVTESSRAKSHVVVEFEGDLKPKTKKEIAEALGVGEHVSIRCKKKVLA
jgi:hypothetical protein